MKKIVYIFLLLALFAQPYEAYADVPDWVKKLAASYAGSTADPVDYRSRVLTMQYESYDGKKNKEFITTRVYGPLDKKIIKHVILVCHPTTTSNLEVPTGPNQIDQDVKRLVYYDDFSTLVICPDYCGYGISAHRQHPYLIHDVTARNCVDGVVAVLKGMSRWGYSLDDNYATDIVGYSQGGATALACAKYLDSDACPEEIKTWVNLRQTTCGDGPYSAIATVNKYIEWGKQDKDLEYACVLPLIVAAAKDAYDDGCMKTVDVEDFFDPEFLSTGIMDYIKSKSVGTTMISEQIGIKMERQRPKDVFSDKIIDKDTGNFKEESNEYKCLMRALEKADLTKGWQPKHPIYFFHLESDKVVPYANYEEVQKGIEHDYPDMVHYVDAVKVHRSILELDRPLLIPLGLVPIPVPYCTIDVGTQVLNTAGINFFDFSNVDHAKGGIIFYTDYMFGKGLHEW